MANYFKMTTVELEDLRDATVERLMHSNDEAEILRLNDQIDEMEDELSTRQELDED